MREGSRCHGHRPSISNTSVQLRKVRTNTSPASSPRLMTDNSCAIVLTISAATSTSRPSKSDRPMRDLIDLGVLLGYRLPQLAIGRPYDSDHDDENAKDFDPAPDDADEVIDRRFEALDRVLHLRASDCSRRAAYHHDRLRQLFWGRARPARYCHRGTG